LEAAQKAGTRVLVEDLPELAAELADKVGQIAVVLHQVQILRGVAAVALLDMQEMVVLVDIGSVVAALLRVMVLAAVARVALVFIAEVVPAAAAALEF
jgi:hypothetical protein